MPPRTAFVRRAAVAAALLAAAAAAGCGYSSASLVPDRYRTISVEVFSNGTPRHDLEYEVTRAVVEELQSRTHLRVVDRDMPHDLTLTGTLRDVDEDVASRRAFQRIRESDVFVTADVEVSDSTGRAVVEKRKITEREAFVPVIGEEVRSARQEAVRELAERIVRTLEQGW